MCVSVKQTKKDSFMAFAQLLLLSYDILFEASFTSYYVHTVLKNFHSFPSPPIF